MPAKPTLGAPAAANRATRAARTRVIAARRHREGGRTRRAQGSDRRRRVVRAQTCALLVEGAGRDREADALIIERYPTAKTTNQVSFAVVECFRYGRTQLRKRVSPMTAEMVMTKRAPGSPSSGRSLFPQAHPRPVRSRPRRRTPQASTRTTARHRSGAARSEARQLLLDYHERGDLCARERLIQLYLPLVRSRARRYVGRGEQLEDLVQIGTIGLINAIDRFKPERGFELASFAIPTIEGEIKRHLRDKASLVRVPRSLQQELAPVVVLDAATTPVEGVHDGGYELREDRVLLARGFRILEERERRLLHLAYYGELSQAQIADEVGISQIHVSRLTRRALGKLRAVIAHDRG
jgi:RNA polymerase sigma-B factor